jgi:hypothetical protein
MRDRNRNLVVRIDDKEHDRLRALADAADMPAAFLVRKWIAQHYEAAFGAVEPKRAKSAR